MTRLFTSLYTFVLLSVSIGVSALPSTFTPRDAPDPIVSQTTCKGNTFVYQGLSGYGFVPSDFRDKFGDTVSIGSSVAVDKDSWKFKKEAKPAPYYTGTFYFLPDRGWNTNGTTATIPRIHKFDVKFTPAASYPSPPNLEFNYLDTILLTGPEGTPLCGLDPTTVVHFDGYPDLPAATIVGDGFGGSTPVEHPLCIPVDSEGLVLDKRGGFWVSDEYGPYVYRFDESGAMTMAIRPPDAFIPIRNGVQSFSADSPPIYNPSQHPTPPNPTSGRANNQGFEGLTASADGKTLYVLLQSATIQDGGTDKTTNRHTRLLSYDISSNHDATLIGEFVVPLPQFVDPTKKPSANPRTAAQSEILFLDDNQFLIMARDSGFGHGQALSKSVYRHVDIFDISPPTTDIKPLNLHTVSPNGVLSPAITPATYCPFINFNIDQELAKFHLHNGGPQDQLLLNEKWEGLAIMPADGVHGKDDEWYVLVTSDNDFVTQNGFINMGQKPYADTSGFNLDNQVMVFKVKLPDNIKPWDMKNDN